MRVDIPNIYDKWKDIHYYVESDYPKKGKYTLMIATTNRFMTKEVAIGKLEEVLELKKILEKCIPK